MTDDRERGKRVSSYSRTTLRTGCAPNNSTNQVVSEEAFCCRHINMMVDNAQNFITFCFLLGLWNLYVFYIYVYILFPCTSILRGSPIPVVLFRRNKTFFLSKTN